MTAKSSRSQLPPNRATCVVFGIDEKRKHRASAFQDPDASKVHAAARSMGMRSLRIETDQQRDIARKLPRGRFSATGRTVIPLVKPSLFQKIIAVAGAEPPADKPSPTDQDAKPTTPTDSKSNGSGGDDWSRLERGSVVLCHDAEQQAWFEAIVQRIDGDTLTLQWEGWPDLAKFNRSVTQVALLHPKRLKKQK